MKYKELPFELKSFDEETGIFEGHAAGLNNIDDGGDVIKPQAFTKTLKESGHRVKICWQHDPHKPIGLPIEMREDQYGLYVKGELNLESFWGKEAYALMKPLKNSGRPVITDLSIGYVPVKSHIQKDGTRAITELKLYEFSPVTWGMNQNAVITNVKGVIPFKDLPLADKNKSWDGDAAVQQLRKWASSDGSGDKDKVDFNKYKRAFLYVDEEDPENFTSYKMPIAKPDNNGDLKAYPRAIYAAAAAVEGARGGVDISDEEKEKVRNHLTKYYKKMGESPPWDEKAIQEMQDYIKKAADFETVLETDQLRDQFFNLFWALRESLESIIMDPEINDKPALINQSLVQFRDYLLRWIEMAQNEGLLDEFEQESVRLLSADYDMEGKAGRVLSAKNREVVKKALNAMKEADEALNKLLEATQPDSDGKSDDDFSEEEIKSIIEEIRKLKGE